MERKKQRKKWGRKRKAGKKREYKGRRRERNEINNQ